MKSLKEMPELLGKYKSIYDADNVEVKSVFNLINADGVDTGAKYFNVLINSTLYTEIPTAKLKSLLSLPVKHRKSNVYEKTADEIAGMLIENICNTLQINVLKEKLKVDDETYFRYKKIYLTPLCAKIANRAVHFANRAGLTAPTTTARAPEMRELEEVAKRLGTDIGGLIAYMKQVASLG